MSRFTKIRTFAYTHDELPAFHVGCIISALVTALYLNLGVFLLLIAAHMLLDGIKFRGRDGLGYRQTVHQVLRENMIDIMLLTMGLVFAVYFHHSSGLVGISALVRGEVAIVRGLALIVSKFIVIEHVFKLVAHFRHYVESVHHTKRHHYGPAEKCYLYCTAFALFLLAIAPSVMHVEPEVIGTVIAWELAPWQV